MKSTAQFKSHPIHPILVSFPIAFFIGAFIFDIISRIKDDNSFWQTGTYIIVAGIVGAVFAAIAGVIDYIHTVPPQSSAKQRATKHGLINTTVLIIFCVSLYLRTGDNQHAVIVILLELVGVVLMSIAGWMGGTLVHRNQIGIDIRYASAGKWKEFHTNETAGNIEVADIDELKTDQMKLLHIKDKRIVLAKTEDGYVAFEDRCPHKGGSLAGGGMICGTVQCPWHGSQFDVRTGQVKAGPAKSALNTYTIIERDSKVYLKL